MAYVGAYFIRSEQGVGGGGTLRKQTAIAYSGHDGSTSSFLINVQNTRTCLYVMKIYSISHLILVVLFFFLILLFNQTKNKFSLVSISCLEHMLGMCFTYIHIFTKVKKNNNT